LGEIKMDNGSREVNHEEVDQIVSNLLDGIPYIEYWLKTRSSEFIVQPGSNKEEVKFEEIMTTNTPNA